MRLTAAISIIAITGCAGQHRPSMEEVTGAVDPRGNDQGCRVLTTPDDPPGLDAQAFDYPQELRDIECTDTAVLLNGDADLTNPIGGRLWLCRDFTQANLALSTSLLDLEHKPHGYLQQRVTVWTPQSSSRFSTAYSACIGQPKAGWAFIVESFRSGPPVGGPCTGGCAVDP